MNLQCKKIILLFVLFHRHFHLLRFPSVEAKTWYIWEKVSSNCGADSLRKVGTEIILTKCFWWMLSNHITYMRKLSLAPILSYRIGHNATMPQRYIMWWSMKSVYMISVFKRRALPELAGPANRNGISDNVISYDFSTTVATERL